MPIKGVKKEVEKKGVKQIGGEEKRRIAIYTQKVEKEGVMKKGLRKKGGEKVGEEPRVEKNRGSKGLEQKEGGKTGGEKRSCKEELGGGEKKHTGVAKIKNSGSA